MKENSMFAELLKRLTAPSPNLPETEEKLALCAILVRVARSDGDYAPEEIERIDRIIETRFGLSHTEAQEMRRDAETLEQEAPDTVRFTRALKDAVPYQDRLSVIEALWKVALADGVREADEDALLRLVSNLLGVNDVDSAMARQRVTQK